MLILWQLGMLAVLLVMIYGLLLIIHAPLADAYARGLNRTAQRAVTGLGRATGRLINAFPFASGIIVIILVIMALSRF